MRIAIRKDNNKIYIDKNIRSGIDYTSEPYNFILVDIDDKYIDCECEDFNNDLTLNVNKYNLRKLKIIIEPQIAELKQNLSNTDYKAIKFAEGELSEQEYASIRTQRREWRAEINRLEAKLN